MRDVRAPVHVVGIPTNWHELKSRIVVPSAPSCITAIFAKRTLKGDVAHFNVQRVSVSTAPTTMKPSAIVSTITRAIAWYGSRQWNPSAQVPTICSLIVSEIQFILTHRDVFIFILHAHAANAHTC